MTNPWRDLDKRPVRRVNQSFRIAPPGALEWRSLPGVGRIEGMTPLRSAPTPDGPRQSTPESPALAVAAVARRLGVAPATLRTWDRRYGLGPSEHAAGSHRRYTTEDVGRLLIMRGLTLEGVAPVDAARAALAADLDEIAGRAAEREPVRNEPIKDAARPAGDAAPARCVRSCARSPIATAATTARAAGGERPVGVSDILDAAIAYDQERCNELAPPGPGHRPGGLVVRPRRACATTAGGANRPGLAR